MVWRLLFLLSFLSLTVTEVARRCYECQDMPHPSDCRITTLCQTGHECMLESFITSGAFHLYNSGCRSKQMCSGQRRRDIRSSNATSLSKRSDLLICDECCDADFCNDHGCGYTALKQPQRPPLCLYCDAVINPRNCRHVKRCDVDEVCVLTEMRTKADNGDTLYQSGCVNSQVCNMYTMVGKRRRNTYCHVCCHDDYCNDRCESHTSAVPNIPTTSTTSTTTTTTTTTAPTRPTTHLHSAHVSSSLSHLKTTSTSLIPCTDGLGVDCHVLNQNLLLCNDPSVAKMYCPRYCGLC